MINNRLIIIGGLLLALSMMGLGMGLLVIDTSE